MLLMQREDLRCWSLPGGMVEPGEVASEAARREVFEETGINVHLTQLVGVYATPHFDRGHKMLFAGYPSGGTLQPCPIEALDAGYFLPQRLPETLLWWHRYMIEDMLKGVTGTFQILNVRWPPEYPSRAEAFAALREDAGLYVTFQKHFCTGNEDDREIMW
ncbi:hypothetical protein KTH_27810 [Thermosporothrix hazakensis]|uniref:Nudix hydrolase domain-containing protein n=1 Tax=Thermosporothrix sp. COM3 TaxID=2490863 RepID=A0A455SMQ9_9CHLR|nr:hypothetical protein KTC_44740 [Thermosporothrix sp. COM3]GCE47912.1 hypothetical protein KTH_27810 [Thermosporothrix hazakensis]